ncbi:MAG: YihY/virulence factor BrkB family protein [Methylovulum sp.]|nr:YihY/virulence factor BrkB family protein [Methylovulum sp.]
MSGKSSRVWALFSLAIKKFLQMNGAQLAAAFAHYAFFSLFPLIVLFVTIASMFIDHVRAGTEVIAYVESYVPISGDMQHYIFDTITGVVNTRGQASAIALLMLVWAAMQFFTTLVYAANRAWAIQTSNGSLLLKSLGFLVMMIIAMLAVVAVPMPVLVIMARDWLLPVDADSFWGYALGSFLMPSAVVFTGLSLFYRFAPNRPTRFAEVWLAGLCAAALLQVAENVFVIYLQDFATFNVVYGAFGGIMALLLWIYLSGCIVIFGACLCAAQAEMLAACQIPRHAGTE